MLSKPSRLRRAFTLIELLVVIGIIGMLIAIALPVLGRARESARETVALANLKTVGQSFTTYANTYRSWPFRGSGAGLPEQTGSGPAVPPAPGVIFVRWWPDNTIIGISDHFAQEWLWPGIVSVMSDWPENYKTWVSPGRPTDLPDAPPEPDELPNTVSIRYSSSFVARPELFKQGAPADESLLAATRPEEVTFPSAKVMLWDAHLAYKAREPRRVGFHYAAPTPMAFADGHSGLQDPTQATAPVANPLRFDLEIPLSGTPDGVRGRDY